LRPATRVAIHRTVNSLPRGSNIDRRSSAVRHGGACRGVVMEIAAITLFMSVLLLFVQEIDHRQR
jgi:hypothetical protein